MTDFTKEVYEQVKKIPKWKVASYGQIAFLAGNPRASRAVGYALHHNPEPGIIPCHRVVFSDGEVSPAFAFGGKDIQRELLEQEGVSFQKDGHVDMGKCGLTVGAEIQNDE